jgi:hypothetical protein
MSVALEPSRISFLPIIGLPDLIVKDHKAELHTLGALVFDAEEEGEADGGAGEDDEHGAEGGVSGHGQKGIYGGGFFGFDGREALGEEGFDGAVGMAGVGVEDEHDLIFGGEVELAAGEAGLEDGVGGGGLLEVLFEGDLLVEEFEGGLVVVAGFFGVFDVTDSGADDDCREEDEASDEEGPGKGADGEEERDADKGT